MFDSYHQVRAGTIGHEPAHDLLQLARRDLAGAATAARLLGEPEGTWTRHAVKCSACPDTPLPGRACSAERMAVLSGRG
jgi:hypothetical protein